MSHCTVATYWYVSNMNLLFLDLKLAYLIFAGITTLHFCIGILIYTFFETLFRKLKTSDVASCYFASIFLAA